mmetsp:Transcript_4971/g.11952  ORF Transcript_4971/g.11952 Transcript_4971/m.11952 type:complete len:187 (-) Transcript_4971:756-1316(-)
MEFGGLGKHCQQCKTKDFLPFKCKHCNRIFCIEHREQQAHGCNIDITMKNTSPKCPLCGKFIKLNLDEPPDRKMDAHINSGCVLHVLDSTKDKRRNKSPGPKCGLSRCKNEERYELVRCKLCRVEYCLEHRHPSDHSCSRIDIEKKRKEVSARERTRLAQSRLLKEVTKPKGTEKVVYYYHVIATD